MLSLSFSLLGLIGLVVNAAAQWVDWSNQYPYPGHRVYSHTMHRTADGNLLLCGSIHGGWTPGSGIPFEDWAIATYLVKVLPAGDTLWTARLDSLVPSSITHVVDLADGNTLIAGTASSSYTYCGIAVANGPMPQLFALKMDPAGNVLWWHQYEQACSRILADAWETPDERIHLLALDTQEPNIAIGYVQPNWFEHHTLDTQGSTLAVSTYQQTYHYYTSHGATQGFDGGRYVAAAILDTVGQDHLSVQLEKLDANGVPQGAVFVTDTSYCSPIDLITTPDDGLLMLLAPDVSRSRLIRMDTLGNVLWDRKYAAGFRQVLALPDTTYLAVGMHGTFQTPNMRELSVTLISSSGDSVWSRFYGDSLSDLGSSIVTTPTGFVAYGTKDMYSGSVPPRLFLTWDSLGVFTNVGSFAVEARPVLYPVPADDRLFVRIPTLFAGTLRIADAMGRSVREVRAVRGTLVHELDVHDLASGIYLLQAVGAYPQSGVPFIVEH